MADKRINAAPLVWLAVVLPILNPFAPGPSPQVVPILLGGMCIAALLVFFRTSHVRAVAWAWLIASVISSVIGLLQYFGAAPYFAPWASLAEIGEAYGNLRQRNQLATLTNMGVAAMMWCLHDRWMREETRPLTLPWRLAAAMALALLVFGNAASASRIGLIQLLAMIPLAACAPTRWRARLVGIAAAATVLYVIAAFLLPWLLGLAYGVEVTNVFTRLAQTEGCWSRRALWGNVLHLIAERPWTGWGWGELDYAHYATLYEGERFCAILDNAHNLPLHLAVELGIPVALLACAAVVWLVVKVPPWRATTPDHQLAWQVLAVIGLHSMVEYPLWYAAFHTAAGLCVAMLLARPACPADDRAGGGPTRWLRLRTGMAAVLAGVLAMTWHHYIRVSEPYLPYASRNPMTRDIPAPRPPVWAPFRHQALFAELTTTALTPANAQDLAAVARELLHYSPEPRVIQVLIESLTLIGRQDEALWHLARFRAAFPEEYSAWLGKSRPSARPMPASP